MADGCDLIVAGSGAAELAAAVTAAHYGLAVTVLDRATVLGGTTAWSGGWIWAPGNALGNALGKALGQGVDAAPASARDYLLAVLGNRFDAARVDAFLAAAPQMVDFFTQHTALQFAGGFAIPDTYGDAPGAGTGGRSVIARPYDARGLGAAVALLRPPLRETTFHGMTIQAGADLRAFMTMTRSVASLRHVAARVLRHGRDLVRHGRGMDLRNGAALVARLLRSALDLQVDLRTGAQVTRLIREDGRVTGVELADGSRIMARRGVVLAAGGFAQDPARRAAHLPRDGEHHSLAVPEAAGDGLRLAEGVGARLDMGAASASANCPVSRVTWPDGTTGTFPHFIDRGKPGVIGVLACGRRFCNEGLGYHDYVTALLAAMPDGAAARSWLICDHTFLRRYGLGVVRPAPVPWRGWTRAGYLTTADSIEGLARACGFDAGGLAATVTAWNASAERGEDAAFGRGRTPYMRAQGDSAVTPNPCVAPIVRPPFHAVMVVPGSFGTFAGIATDGLARALDDHGAPIPGLYAAGTDAASVFGGYYPAGGIALGPALTFGHIAGRHAAGVSVGVTP